MSWCRICHEPAHWEGDRFWHTYPAGLFTNHDAIPEGGDHAEEGQQQRQRLLGEQRPNQQHEA